MTKKFLLGASALRTVAAFGLALTAISPAYAQDVPSEDPPETLNTEVEVESGQDAQATEAAQSGKEVTVTGSRIRRPNLESNVPITSIAGEALLERGDTNIGDALNDLPQLRPTRQANNSNLAVGVAGLNLLDLRGLGTVRTLVLVNGRRHVASDITSTASSVDVNSIPADLIERVDIVTGGSSAVYGSNAIAGVVNFVLRRDFEGLQVRGQAGEAAAGYGRNEYVSAMFGRNFLDGRANITLHGEYSHHDLVVGSEVPHIRRNDGFVVVDTDGPFCTSITPRIPSNCDTSVFAPGTDGNPDRVFFRDIRGTTISPYGLVPITQPTSNPACGVGVGNTVPFNCILLFQPNGALVPATGGRVGQGLNGTLIGGNASTQREFDLVTVYPKYDRYNFNLLTHYEISDLFEPFLEAKFSRTQTVGSNAGAAFVQGTGTFDFRERPRVDNPFLSTQARTTITNAILASGCNPSLNVTCATLTTAQRNAYLNGSGRFVIARNLIDIGPRYESFERDTFRVVTGVRGNFNDDWNYELSVNYGKMKEETVRTGYVDRQRFMLAMDAGINPATGQIQCRSQFDPASRVAFDLPGTSLTAAQRAGFVARLASDIAACVPYNPFGASDNSASAAYFGVTEVHHDTLDQLVVQGFMAGDTSQWFELPGGPISFAVGAEYRRDGASYDQDEFTATGAPNTVAIGNIPLVHTDVKEAFAEVQIPILKNRRFFEDLSINAAGRVAAYGGSIGSVYAYNAGGEWSPFHQLKLRGNYARAVRAPNVSETAFPIVPNFSPGFQDPCRANLIDSGSQYRRANCTAVLGSLLTNPSFATIGNISLPVLSGSNPNLREETSDSYTYGVVVQPMAGISISADYYDITVNNVISSPSAQTIVNTCYDLPSLDNPFCALFSRYLGSTVSPAQEIPGQVANGTLLQAPVNYAKLERRGIDFEIAARQKIGQFRVDGRLIYALNLKNRNFLNPVDPDFYNDNLREVGTPKHEARFDASVGRGPFTFSWGTHFIGRMVTPLEVEDLRETQGRPPQNADYADILKYPATFYHNVRFDVDLHNVRYARDLNLYLGVDNLLDTTPPLGLQGNGERSSSSSTTQGTAIYESFGRRIFAGFKVKF